MGKWKENPRYHVLSCRASDEERKEIEAVVPNGKRAEFILQAVLEKVRRVRRGQGGRKRVVADEA